QPGGAGLRQPRPDAATLAAQALEPALVDAPGHLVQPVDPGAEVALDFPHRLHARARVPLLDFARAFAAPRMHHLLGHLDVALQPEMLAERETLVGAVRVGQHARRAGRDRERLAVPVERFECGRVAEPLSRDAVIFDLHAAPADFRHAVT